MSRREEMLLNMVQALQAERMVICEGLHRYGLSVGAEGKIIMVNRRMPVMACGIEPPPLQKNSDELKPIICWYRLVPSQVKKEDGTIEQRINEEYSHYEEAKVQETTKNGRPTKKSQPIVILPPVGALPTPRGGTTFSGKWVWHQKWRTDEVSPKIIDEWPRKKK